MSVPLEPWNRLVSKGFQMAQLHLQLSEHYKEQGLSLFNITTKTHFCLHVYLLARHIHPSITWCYKGEHMMKLSQKLFKSCLSGNKHWNVGRVAALKFRHLLHLKLRNEWWGQKHNLLLRECRQFGEKYMRHIQSLYTIYMRFTKVLHMRNTCVGQPGALACNFSFLELLVDELQMPQANAWKKQKFKKNGSNKNNKLIYTVA